MATSNPNKFVYKDVKPSVLDTFKSVGSAVGNTLLPYKDWKHVVLRSQQDQAAGKNPITDPGYWKTAASAIGQTAGLAGGVGGKVGKSLFALGSGTGFLGNLFAKPAPTNLYTNINPGNANNFSTFGYANQPQTGYTPYTAASGYAGYNPLNPITGQQVIPKTVVPTTTPATDTSTLSKEFQDLIARQGQINPSQQAALNAAKAAATQQFNQLRLGAENNIRQTDLGTASALENQYRQNTGASMDTAGLMSDLGMPLTPAQYGGTIESVANQSAQTNANTLMTGANTKAQELQNIINGKVAMGNASADVALQKAQMLQANKDTIAKLFGIGA